MATLDQIEKRRKRLLELLLEHGSITLEACMNELDIGKRTLLDDVAELRRQNYEIKRKKNILYGSEIGSRNTFEHSSRATVRQAFILRLFQENGGAPKDDAHLYKDILEDMNFAYEISSKTFRKDIQTLIGKGYLTKNADRKICPTSKSYLIKEYSSEDSEEMLTRLYNYSHGDDLDPLADSVIQKISRELYYKLCTDTDISPAPYFTFKKKYPGNLTKAFSIFQNCNFHHHILRLRYKPKESAGEEFLFCTGKLVYSMAQSRLYAMGKDGSGTLRLLNFEYIASAEETEDSNPEYIAKEYQQICREMFIVSVEKPFQAKIFFKDELQVMDKIRRLHKSRPDTSSLTEYQNGMLYQDTIRGFYDFARYLRGFGRSCKVIEPQRLQESLIRSSRILTDEYRQILEKENS